jgi:hypothetical protein
MKRYIVNCWIYKNNQPSRSNFNISTDKNTEGDLKALLLEKCKESEKWIFDKDEFELIEKESVIRYKIFWKK